MRNETRRTDDTYIHPSVDLKGLNAVLLHAWLSWHSLSSFGSHRKHKYVKRSKLEHRFSLRFYVIFFLFSYSIVHTTIPHGFVGNTRNCITRITFLLVFLSLSLSRDRRMLESIFIFTSFFTRPWNVNVNNYVILLTECTLTLSSSDPRSLGGLARNVSC